MPESQPSTSKMQPQPNTSKLQPQPSTSKTQPFDESIVNDSMVENFALFGMDIDVSVLNFKIYHT